MTRRLVDATGTRRRLRALAALGHDATTIVAHLGDPPASRTRVFQWRHPHRHLIDADTAAAVADVYRRLSRERGSNPTARIRALKAGFLPPAAWAGIDIDSPDEKPHPRQPHHRAGCPTPDDEDGDEAA